MIDSIILSHMRTASEHDPMEFHDKIQKLILINLTMHKKKQSIPIYRLFNRVLYWLCGQKPFQQVFYSRMVSAIRSFYNEHKPAMGENEFIRQVIFNNSGDLRKWILFSYPVDRILAHIHVEGVENLLTEAQKGKGLILVNFHTGLSQATHLVLKTMGIAKVTHSISKSKHGDRTNNNDPIQEVEEDFSMQSIKAVDTLFNGGLVFLSIDGIKGSSHGMYAPFLKRWHTYKTGFAELAFATGAPVIPVSTSLMPDGTVQIRFHPNLDMGDDLNGKESRLKGIIFQLSEFIADQWLTLPTTIKFKRLLFHIKQPVVQDALQLPIRSSEPEQRSRTKHGFSHYLLKKIRQAKKRIIHQKTH